MEIKRNLERLSQIIDQRITGRPEPGSIVLSADGRSKYLVEKDGAYRKIEEQTEKERKMVEAKLRLARLAAELAREKVAQ